MPRLAIVIVTYNSRDDIDRCLGSLIESPPRAAHEIVVVDNASRDGTAAHVRARWPGVRVIDAGGNRGFAAATNLGIRASSGELLLLLNPDTSVPAGAIDTLLGRLDARPDAAIAGPRIVDGNGRAEVSFGPMPSPLAELRQKLLVRGNARAVRPIAWYVERATRRARSVAWVSGACLLIRRADLDAAGLLDERYFLYFEDVDLCAAVRRRGRQVLFEPAAEIVHLRGRSTPSAPAAVRREYRRSQLAFYEKHRPLWAAVVRSYLRWRKEMPDA